MTAKVKWWEQKHVVTVPKKKVIEATLFVQKKSVVPLSFI